MTEKRNITKEDILLKARLRAEGARIDVEKSSQKGIMMMMPTVVFDGCDMVAGTRPNPHSRLEVVVDGNEVTISEGDEVLGTGTLEIRASWRDKLMSDGTTVDGAISQGCSSISNIIINRRCAIADAGKGCKFCALSALPAGTIPSMSSSELLKLTERTVEATVVAIQSGWRGTVLLVGGMLPPSKRGSKMTDMFEKIMTQFRESLDDDTLSEMHIAPSGFPPDDLAEMYKWKDFGINATEFDNQVMEPAYFKAICPGRGEQSRWFEAQEVSAEVFGRGRGATTALVAGIEPMAGLLEGIEERMSKGVYSKVQIFHPGQTSVMGAMQPPSAEWVVEFSEKLVDIYMRYADTFDVDLTEDDRWGYTRRGQSFFSTPNDDELIRRLQEMGKLPPGLPKQDGIEPA